MNPPRMPDDHRHHGGLVAREDVVEPAEPLPDASDAAADDEPSRRSGTVPAHRHGARLDRMLVDLAPEHSRSHLQTLVEAGLVRVDGQPATSAARKLRAGQQVDLDLVLPPSERPVVGEPIPLAIVHEDDDVLVVDKPVGLVVHPAPGHWRGTLLHGLVGRDPACAALPRGGIVHRLDKDTSGLMVVARTLPAMVALVRALAQRDVHREYLAIVHGRLPSDRSTLDQPIGRDPVSRVRMAVVPHGRPSRTDVEVLARSAAFSLVRCRLHTGRTHQIRVHLSASGHPLVADTLYGGREALGLQRQALHAARLGLVHPRTGQPMTFSTPLPPDLQDAWDRVRVDAGFGPASPAAEPV